MAELWPGGPITLPHTLSHDGVEVVIPEQKLSDLLYWLSSGQWWQLYPNAADQEALQPLKIRLFDPDDHLDMIHLHDVGTTLFGRLTGMAPTTGTGWWPSVRLAHIALTQWPLFNAWCVQHGVDPLAGTLMSTTGAIYAWIRDGLGPEQLAKFEQELWSTPARASAPSVPIEELPEHVRQDEAGAFLAAMGESLPGAQTMQGVF